MVLHAVPLCYILYRCLETIIVIDVYNFVIFLAFLATCQRAQSSSLLSDDIIYLRAGSVTVCALFILCRSMLNGSVKLKIS